MELGLGVMKMRSEDFWDTSPHEFYAALNGFSQFHSSSQPAPLDRSELTDLMERYPD